MSIKETINTVTHWIAGLFLLFFAFLGVTAGAYLAALLSLLGAAICLPPIRGMVEARLAVELPPRWISKLAGGLFILSLALLAHTVLQQMDEEARAVKDAADAARQEQSRLESDHYRKNKERLLASLREKLQSGSYVEAEQLIKNYQRFDSSEELQKLAKVAEVGRIKLSIQHTEPIHVEQLAKLYSRLATLVPEHPTAAKEAERLAGIVATERRKQERTRKLKAQFSAWDGSHPGIVQSVKASMHNPKSFEHVETRYAETPEGMKVQMRFRGTNGFGGVITSSVIAVVDENGNVLRVDTQ